MQWSLSGIRAGIVLGFVGSALLLPAQALAQDNAPPPAASPGSVAPPPQPPASSAPAPGDGTPTRLEKIIVTGSAIARTDQETAAPVQIITKKDIERSGLTTVADVVRSISADNSGSLPSAFEGAFAGGAAGVALRGLTVNSTLVLIDGRRVANYALDDDGERGFVDLNSIPLVAVERIEVLKDGASALYGADAIAGVVNIITQHEYVGREVTAEVGDSQHGGGFHTRYTGEFGTGHINTDGYNAYFTIEYQRDEAIKAIQRPFPFNTNNLSSIGGLNGQANQTEAGSPVGSFNGTVEPGVLAPGATASPLNVIPDPNQSGVPQLLNPQPCLDGSTYAQDTDPADGGVFCSINPYSYADLQPRVSRVGVHGKIEVKLNEDTHAFLKATFYDTRTQQAGNLGTGPAQINSTNGSPNTYYIGLPPTIPGPNGTTVQNPNDPFAASGDWALIQYQFADIPTYTTLDNQNYRMVGGVKGSFEAWGTWDYDTALTINHTSLQTSSYGDLLTNQLLADIMNGSYNFLHSLGPTPQSVLNALSPVDSVTNTSDLDMADFRVSRELLPLRGGPLGLAMGVEYRYEAQSAPQLDPTLTNPDGTTYNEYLSTFDLHTAQVFGKHDVTGLYTEVDAPVLSSLDIDGAFRYDHYTDTADHGITPKLGIKWTPIKQLALRGTFSEGFRAPSFAESGVNSSTLGYVNASAESYFNIPPGTNPCTVSAFIASHCVGGASSNGVADAYVANVYSQGGLTAGNPQIAPEKARNFTLGAVIQPIDEVSVSVDYYHIKKTNMIVPYPSSIIYSGYFANPTGYTPPAGTTLSTGAADPQFPDAPRLPTLVTAPYINANDETTQGYDIDLQAHFHPVSAVKITSEFNYTEIMSFRLDQPGEPSFQYAGTQGPYQLSSGAGTPRDRFTFMNTVEYGPLTLTAIFSWVDGYKELSDDYNFPPTCIYSNANGTPLPTSCTIAPFDDIDLVGNYKILRNLDLTLNIQNLMDSKPPIDPADYAGTNYNPTYTQKGVVGRFFIGGVHYRF